MFTDRGCCYNDSSSPKCFHQSLSPEAQFVINQKDVVTLLGTEESSGQGYAAKMWSGLLLDLYLPRWSEFFRRMKQAVHNSTALQLDFSGKAGCTVDSYCHWVNRYDEAWLRRDTRYATKPSQADAVALSEAMYSTYSHLLPGSAPPAHPPSPPPAPIAGSNWIGCFTDGDGGKRDLPKLAASPMPSSPDPVQECAKLCTGYKYLGLQDGMQCLCGNRFGSQGHASGPCCGMRCAGNESVICGGNNCNSVWSRPTPLVG